MQLQEQVQLFESLTKELEQALKHSQICEKHFASQEVPRGCAHAFALEGHLVEIHNLLNQSKVIHSKMAKV